MCNKPRLHKNKQTHVQNNEYKKNVQTPNFFQKYDPLNLAMYINTSLRYFSAEITLLAQNYF